MATVLPHGAPWGQGSRAAASCGVWPQASHLNSGSAQSYFRYAQTSTACNRSLWEWASGNHWVLGLFTPGMWGFPSRCSLPIQSPLQMGLGWRCRQCTSKHGACSFPLQKAWEDRYREKKFTVGNIIYSLFFLSFSEREWERKGHYNSTTRPIFTVICHLWSEQMKNDLQFFFTYVCIVTCQWVQVTFVLCEH